MSTKFSCPVCSKMFTEDILQLHVEAHFSAQSALEERDREIAKSLQETEYADSLEKRNLQQQDLLLAKSLQQKEENEKEDFKKLQAMHGMDGSSGGYKKQAEKRMRSAVGRSMDVAEYYERKQEMMERLASGEDDMKTAQQHIIAAIRSCYDKGVRDVISIHTSGEVTCFSSNTGDKGWGCGYRNLQMVVSALLMGPRYSSVFDFRKVPSIPRLQQLIENAWTQGFDVAGREQLGGMLYNTRKWIGATEVAACLRSYKICARIVDFHKATGANKTHPLLIEWVCSYFQQPSQPPLYLQHHGHSRLCIGVEKQKSGAHNLLIVDPSCHGVVEKLRKDCRSMKILRRSLNQLKEVQYQVVFVDGIIQPSDLQQSKVLTSIRIP